MTEQVNDPNQCPNGVCRSEQFDTYDVDELGDRVIYKRHCDDCDWAWRDTYKLEFLARTDVRSG